MHEVTIDVGEEQLPDISCITRHGPALRHLRATFTKFPRREKIYSIEDIMQLRSACSNLEVLGLSLVNIEFPVGQLPKPLNISTLDSVTEEDKHLANSLDAIAQFPKLRTLCLPHCPWLSSRTTLERQFRHQQIANSILAFLDKVGSSVNLLAFNPPGYYGREHVGDENDHMWPNYYYWKGKVTPTGGACKDTGATVAIPIKKSVLSEREAFCNLSELSQVFVNTYQDRIHDAHMNCYGFS